MQKEFLFQEIIDKNILNINDLLTIANIPSPETFMKGNLSCGKKLVDKKQRDCANIVFSDYFSFDESLKCNGMFLIYVSLLKEIKSKVDSHDLDNEMFIKLKQFLNDFLDYDGAFDYDCDDLNGGIINTMNQFNLYITKLHASFITNLGNYLNVITNNQYQNHNLHLKSMQDYLYFNVDVISTLSKLKLNNIDEFNLECDYILDGIDGFILNDINYQVAKKLSSNFDDENYKLICLSKISLIYREIKIFKIGYKILNEKEGDEQTYKDAIRMLKNIGLFLYETINELISKPNINL